MPDQNDTAPDWTETKPGYGHGFPPFIPGTRVKLLSRGGTRLSPKVRTGLNAADLYFLRHLHARYGTKPFKRGDLDAGRLNRLLGKEITFATEDADPLSRETLLRVAAAGAPTPDRKTARQYRYGDKSTTAIVLDVVRGFRRPVSSAEVRTRVAETVPNFRLTNVLPDLSTLSVNCFSRGNYSVNKKPRRTDGGNPNDKLIKISTKGGSLYDLYDPSIHGVWELADLGDKVLRPRFVSTPDVAELNSARDTAATEGLFDPGEDARRRVMAAIVQREGQPAFRRELLRSYGGACAISGCTIEALLEAAHIVPYRGAHTNVTENGLLLRADLHKLFDLHLLCIDPETRTVRLNDALLDSEYGHYNNVQMRSPVSPDATPAWEALRHHFERCAWTNVEHDDGPQEGD